MPKAGERGRKGVSEGAVISEITEDIPQLQEGQRLRPCQPSGFLQTVGVHIVDIDHRPGFGFAMTIAAPKSAHQRKTFDGLARGQAIAGGRQDEFGLTVGAILAKARDGVLDLGIGESPLDQVEIATAIDAWIDGTTGMISSRSSFSR